MLCPPYLLPHTGISSSMPHPKRSFVIYLPLIAILLLGLVLRLYRLDALPLRGDEGFSAQNWAGQSFLTTLQTTATIEPHPPLTYAVFRVWGVLFGTQHEGILRLLPVLGKMGFAPDPGSLIMHEGILRLLPVLGNLIGIAGLYALGRRLHSHTAGLLAAFFWAINPYQIWHAQDFRNYALWSTTSVVALWLAVRVMQRRRSLDWALYGISMFLSAMIFYFDLLAMGAVGLFVLIVYRREWGFVVRWLVLNGAIALIVIATFLVLQGSLVGSGAYAGTTAYADPLKLITVFLPTIAFGDTMPEALLAALGVGFALLFLVGLWFIAQKWGRPADVLHQNGLNRPFSPLETSIFLACVGIVPLVALCLAAIKFGIFTPRYVMLSAPAYSLTGAIVIAKTRLRTHPRYDSIFQLQFLGVSLFFGWVVLNIFTLNLYYHDATYAKTRDWRALSVYLAQNVTVDDVVIQTAVDAGFGYYYHLSGGAALDIGLPRNFDQPADEIRTILQTRTAMHRSLWVVARTFDDWANFGVVEEWVDANLQRVRQTVIDELPVRQYMPWDVSPDEIDAAPVSAFGPYVELAGARVFTPPEPTGELTIWLYWQPTQTSEMPLKVFVHLIGQEFNPATGSPLWTQSDYEPQQGRIHTNSWEIGMLYRDVYTLTVRDLPPGEYQIVAGLYDPATNERVLTDEGEDSVPIGILIIP